MKRSRGTKSKSRHKLRKAVRERSQIPISRIMHNFEVGDKVHIVIDPSIQKGQPHHRFHGKTGTVLGRRGRGYLVEIMDGNSRKTLISVPVHLKSQEKN